MEICGVVVLIDSWFKFICVYYKISDTMQKPFIFHVFFVFCFFVMAGAYAQAPSDAFRSTAYPLPRFASMGSGESYVRAGPGMKFPVKWVLTRKGLPVEIILEFDAWRKIKDIDGDEGWVHQSLLSGRRTAFVKTDGGVEAALHRKPGEDTRIIAKVQSNAIVEIESCTGSWCRVNASGYKGWIERASLWGVYPDEEIKD